MNVFGDHLELTVKQSETTIRNNFLNKKKLSSYDDVGGV